MHKRKFLLVSAAIAALYAGAAYAASNRPSSEALLSDVVTIKDLQQQTTPGSVVSEAASIIQLADVMKYAYENNPALKAARQELLAVQEDMAQALSGWKPTVSANSNVTASDTTGSNFGGTGTTSKEIGLSLNQPLFRGGRTMAATSEAEARIWAQRELLEAAEQNLMLDVATAYMDVLRDQALLNLSRNNEQVLAEELKATKQRFDVGDLTRTDVSQAEARLAAAKADRVGATGDLQSSKAFYRQVTGLYPGDLVNPNLQFPLPPDLNEAVEFAEEHSPKVLAANYLHESSESATDEVFGELLPELGFFGSWDKAYDPQPGLIDESTTKSVGVKASIPLYQAGSVRSRVRQAKHTANQRYMEILDARRTVRQEVVSNWEMLLAARAEIEARKTQMDASKIALDGVKAENSLGSRTVLDVLDAEQEFLDARVAHVSAQRDVVVAEFALASTLGILVPESYGARGSREAYDRHLQDIKWKILGMDVDIARDSP